MCGACTTDVRAGCDSVAGSGLALDSCGVCDGPGTECALACEKVGGAHPVCESNVDVATELGQTSTAACLTYVAGLGGRVILRNALLSAADCGETIVGWQLDGYTGLRACITAQPNCQPQNSFSYLDITCVKKKRTLDKATWQADTSCPSVSRSAIVCSTTTNIYSAYDSTMPDTAGTFSLTERCASSCERGIQRWEHAWRMRCRVCSRYG